MEQTEPGRDQPTDADRARLRDELATYTEQRQQLAASLRDRGPGDDADAAEAMERADELHRVDERIARLRSILNGVHDQPEGALPVGTRATLRYADGDEEIVEIGYLGARSRGGSVITADSPLAHALAAHKPGDEISWRAPSGHISATLVSLDRP